MNIKLAKLLLFLLLLSSCNVPKAEPINVVTETVELNTPEQSETGIGNKKLATNTPTKPTSTLNPPTATPIPVSQVCSPVDSIQLEDITAMIFNPFNPPGPGSDDPHQGVDLSDVDLDTMIAKSGLGVHSIINSRVSMVINNRFPYGNAVLTETNFDSLPAAWQETILNESKPEKWGNSPVLTCPSGWDSDPESYTNPSLFILYAHLENTPDLKPGQLLSCGEPIGNIGMSGNALSPHVHIEMRYGPPTGLEGGMAHYDTTASQIEMSNYCRWRVSGWYRLLNPIEVLLQK